MHHTPVCQAKFPAQKSAPHMRRVAPAAQTTAAPPPNRAVSFFYLLCVCTHRERVLGAVSGCFIFLAVFFVCVHTHTHVYMVHDCVRLRARVCVRAYECENIYSCTTLSLCNIQLHNTFSAQHYIQLHNTFSVQFLTTQHVTRDTYE